MTRWLHTILWAYTAKGAQRGRKQRNLLCVLHERVLVLVLVLVLGPAWVRNACGLSTMSQYYSPGHIYIGAMTYENADLWRRLNLHRL